MRTRQDVQSRSRVIRTQRKYEELILCGKDENTSKNNKPNQPTRFPLANTY